MPIYEYSCNKCGKQFEVLIRKKGDEPAKCPSCGARGPRKILSSFAVSVQEHGASSSKCHDCGTAGTGCCGSSCSADFDD